MNKITVKILAPNARCKRTQRIIRLLQKFFDRKKKKAEFIIITDLDEIMQYNTWLLPTILINDVMLARGYMPPEKEILEVITRK